MAPFANIKELQDSLGETTTPPLTFIQANCEALWNGLLGGLYRVRGGFTTATCTALVLSGRPRDEPPIAPRQLQIMERALLGERMKVTAIDMSLALSTVAISLKQSLSALGVQDSPSRVPLALVMLVRAAHGRSSVEMMASQFRSSDGSECILIGAALPPLDRLLSPAIVEVVHMRAKGYSHAEIAARRGRSPRTIANQLATAYDRLGKSSRSGLLEYLSSACGPTRAA